VNKRGMKKKSLKNIMTDGNKVLEDWLLSSKCHLSL
jgi:hypothetical protein